MYIGVSVLIVKSTLVLVLVACVKTYILSYWQNCPNVWVRGIEWNLRMGEYLGSARDYSSCIQFSSCETLFDVN